MSIYKLTAVLLKSNVEIKMWRGPALTLGVETVDVADAVRVLGVLFTPDLALDKHTSAVSRGDSLHRFRSNFAGPTGTWVRLAVQNFTSIGPEGWECGPQNIKNFHFLVKSRPVGATPLADFEIFWGLLYAWISYVNVSNFMWFTLQVTELLRRNRASVN